MNEISDLIFLKEIIRRGQFADKGYFEYVHIVACLLDKRLHESLTQLVNGPVWDGDVVSKSMRDELIGLGLATRICCKGEQGYTGATYFGGSVSKRINAIRKGEVGE
jgi:hypothetical protein